MKLFNTATQFTSHIRISAIRFGLVLVLAIFSLQQTALAVTTPASYLQCKKALLAHDAEILFQIESDLTYKTLAENSVHAGLLNNNVNNIPFNGDQVLARVDNTRDPWEIMQGGSLSNLSITSPRGAITESGVLSS